MECPYCNSKMEKGFMQSTHRIIWSPDIKGMTVSWPNKKKGEMIINNKTRLIAGYIEANVCRNCKKLIVDYSN